MDGRGIALLAVVAVALTVLGGAVAAPVAVSVVDVAPDHPLYPLKKIGEDIRGFDNFRKAKVRWAEYQKMVEVGKGVKYQAVLQEFLDKVSSLEPRPEVSAWLKEQEGRLLQVRLKLAEQAVRGRPELENELALIRMRPENARAFLCHLAERSENAEYRRAEELCAKLSERMRSAENIPAENILLSRLYALYNEFSSLFMTVQGMLSEVPENLPGRVAAVRLCTLAQDERNAAVQAEREGRLGRAFGLMTAAVSHLRNAKTILEHAEELEPQKASAWRVYRDAWRRRRYL